MIKYFKIVNKTYQIDFSSKGIEVKPLMLVYFGCWEVVVVLEVTVAVAGVSYLGKVQQVARHPFVCTFPYAAHFVDVQPITKKKK